MDVRVLVTNFINKQGEPDALKQIRRATVIKNDKSKKF